MLTSGINIKELLAQAKSSFESKNYGHAAIKYQQVFNSLSNTHFLSKATSTQLSSYAKICNCLGLSYLYSRQPAKVLAALSAPSGFEHVIDTLPIHYLRARALAGLKRTDDAVIELSQCTDQTDELDFNPTWFESRMFLATLYIDRKTPQSAQQLLTSSLAYLQNHHEARTVELNSYMNYMLEVHFHLAQVYRIQSDFKKAMQTLSSVYALYLSLKDTINSSTDLTLRDSLLTVVSQLFMLLNENDHKEEAFLLLADFSIFETLTSLAPKIKEQVLVTLLMYAKLATEKNELAKANLALKSLLSLCNNDEDIENKFILLFVKLIGVHYLRDAKKAEQLFQLLIEHYHRNADPAILNDYILLEAFLPLFPNLDAAPFAAQREILAIQLRKFKITVQAPALLEEVSHRLNALEIETASSLLEAPAPAVVIRKPSSSSHPDKETFTPIVQTQNVSFYLK